MQLLLLLHTVIVFRFNVLGYNNNNIKIKFIFGQFNSYGYCKKIVSTSYSVLLLYQLSLKIESDAPDLFHSETFFFFFRDQW